MSEVSDSISDDEFLYRRIPEALGYYSGEGRLNREAFHPHKERDKNGISVSRALQKLPEEYARSGRLGKKYYVAVVRVGSLKENDLVVIPDPKPDDLGHALIPQVNSENRREDLSLHWQELLAQLCLRVEGPFSGFKQPE